MPHSLEAEQSVIGSMFIDAEAIAAATEQISGEDFYNRQYGVVFDTIVLPVADLRRGFLQQAVRCGI